MSAVFFQMTMASARSTDSKHDDEDIQVRVNLCTRATVAASGFVRC